MNYDELDEALADVLDTRAGRSSGKNHRKLSEAERVEIESLVDVADLLWEATHGAPALEADPVAAALGLTTDPGRTLDSKALRRARSKAGMKPTELARRLTSRGWSVTAGDVFRWENGSAADVVPAQIEAIAQETGSSAGALMTDRAADAEPDLVDAATRSSRFDELVRRWARIQEMSVSDAARSLRFRMLGAVHRGGRPDTDRLLDALDAFVASMEQRPEIR